MEFKETTNNGVLIFKSTDNTASISNAKSFKDLALDRIENGNSKLIIDLTNVPLIDSTFLGAIVVAHRKAVSVGGGIKLVGMNESVLTLIGLTKLEKVFPNFESVDGAISSF